MNREQFGGEVQNLRQLHGGKALRQLSCKATVGLLPESWTKRREEEENL